MTRHHMTSDTALVDSKPSEPQVVTESAPTSAQRTRTRWPLVVVLAGALAMLAVWTLSQADWGAEPVDTPRIYSDHDPWIQGRLRDRADRTSQQQAAQHDPWIQARLRGQTGAAAVVDGEPFVTHDALSQYDSGIAAQLRARTGQLVTAD